MHPLHTETAFAIEDMLVYAPTFVGTTNQTPPVPSPFAWPGALSPEKVYSGCPLYSTWLPLALATTVSLAAVGVSNNREFPRKRG